ncbi:MAG: sodium-dependent transporter [Candidatus Electryonea clarkiae]|nr:sodium-dependent transporter [Candidatus Electryonea clarkiae]MDP8285822.1 sodium-dependent transporter [Candidatus Electryonea clarkiae]
MASSGGIHRETWGSKTGFILAAAGSAIGLGNIWRFPYILGENGGFAFLLIWIICNILIGLPILGAELAIGRGSNRNPVGAFKALMPGTAWWLVGFMGLITGVIILSFYSIVAGWTLAYLVKSVTGVTVSYPDAEASALAFENFVSSGGQIVIYSFVFTLLCMIVVSQGVKSGIEKWSKILMPTLFILIIILIVRSLTLKGGGAGLAFLFKPDFSKITLQVIVMAMGQAFFSLSLGMGVMITYGSYVDRKTNIINSAGSIMLLNMSISILAGLALIPAVFAMGFQPSSGVGLTFHVLPLVFSKLPFGTFLSIIFFFLLSIAALTSAISLLEVMVSYATDELRWSRPRATVIMAAIAFLFGVPAALSFGVWSEIKIFGLGFFDLSEYITANVLLPIGGILIALFAGWVWGRARLEAEIKEGNPDLKFYKVWLWMIRIVAPVAVATVLVTSLLPEKTEEAQVENNAQPDTVLVTETPGVIDSSGDQPTSAAEPSTE